MNGFLVGGSIFESNKFSKTIFIQKTSQGLFSVFGRNLQATVQIEPLIL